MGLESGVASVTDSSTIFGARSTRKSLSSSLELGTGMGLEDSLRLEGGTGWGCSLLLVSSDLDDVERSGSKSSKRLSHPAYYGSGVCVWVCAGVHYETKNMIA